MSRLYRNPLFFIALSTICALLPKTILADQNKTYVTAHLMGQLGNQLFEVAATLCYAWDHGCEARFPQFNQVIDGDQNAKYVFHRLNLSNFPENSPFIDYYEHSDLNGTMKQELDIEPDQNIIFHGYFQSENFFAHHREKIRSLFAISEEIKDLIQKKYGPIFINPTVAVHVRTFFKDNINPALGVGRENWEYFIQAIHEFPKDYTFLIFSDDISYVKKHFPKIRQNIHFIESNFHCLDFYLMSLCDHQIISPSSTFSWWAAWLNPNPEKIVIAPDDSELSMHLASTPGGFPENWKIIPLFLP